MMIIIIKIILTCIYKSGKLSTHVSMSKTGTQVAFVTLMLEDSLKNASLISVCQRLCASLLFEIHFNG